LPIHGIPLQGSGSFMGRRDKPGDDDRFFGSLRM